MLSYAVTMLSSGTIAVLGEILGMWITKTPLNQNRFLRWFLIGTFFIGIALKVWYGTLGWFVNDVMKIGDVVVDNFAGAKALAIAKTQSMTELESYLFDC